ncbi:hypothetical protein ANCCAN_12138 [Ancylostoma caninum]|uniref:Uncharacterized protein n=1 Tax=Ancylostoma caninum TaxID=29170 RepID=A0A368GC03_ANCCA|nr:hypothetical protein ANCCAN_12138 [Ancylostoma caninum]
MAYRSTPCQSGPDHLSPPENFLGRKLRTMLDLMNPCPGDHVEQRDVKMEAVNNRHNGARRSRFEVDDAVYAKDYRRQENIWTPGFIVRLETLLTPSAVEICCENHFHCQSGPGPPDDSTPDDAAKQSTPPLRRSSRQHRAPDRLNLDPTKKMYL